MIGMINFSDQIKKKIIQHNKSQSACLVNWL